MIFSRISKVAWWVSNFFPKKLIFRIFCDQVLKWKFPSFDGHLEKNIFSWKTFLQNFARFRTFPSLSPPTQCVGDSNYESLGQFYTPNLLWPKIFFFLKFEKIHCFGIKFEVYHKGWNRSKFGVPAWQGDTTA